MLTCAATKYDENGAQFGIRDITYIWPWILASDTVMPIDIDFDPKVNLLSVCVVETDGSNVFAQMQNTNSQSTGDFSFGGVGLVRFLRGMYFHHDCADAGRPSWGLLGGK